MTAAWDYRQEKNQKGGTCDGGEVLHSGAKITAESDRA